MKTIDNNYIPCLLLAVCCSSCQPEEKQINYPNGKTEYSYQLVGGKQNGISNAYYPNGTLKSKSYWREGKQNGPASFYYPDGNLESTSNWLNGTLCGESKSFFKNGLLREMILRDAVGRIQKVQEYHPNGEKKIIITFSELTNLNTIILFNDAGEAVEKQVKNLSGVLLYAGSFERGGQEILGIIVPLFSNATDTIQQTDNYKADLHFGLKINPNTKLLLSSSKFFKPADTLSADFTKQGATFHIIIATKQIGHNKFYFKFLCPSCKADTLAATEFYGSHSFVVKKSES